MPHVIYLHSALTQDRIVVKDPDRMRRLMRFERIDVIIAMGLAGFVNAAMLMMAAATFHQVGATNVAGIEQAHQTLTPLLGRASSVVFAISLLASGLSSSAVGTMAGQVIMQGFLRWHIPITVRRLVTMAPALIVIYMGLDPTRSLVISQVVLSFGIPLALVPLVMFTTKPDLMGPLRNHRVTSVVAWVIAGLISLLNVYLLWQTFIGSCSLISSFRWMGRRSPRTYWARSSRWPPTSVPGSRCCTCWSAPRPRRCTGSATSRTPRRRPPIWVRSRTVSIDVR
jgi:manganese transport protein